MGHLTALQMLFFEGGTVLTGGALPHLPALRMLVAHDTHISHPHAQVSLGPRDLNLAAATPLLGSSRCP